MKKTNEIITIPVLGRLYKIVDVTKEDPYQQILYAFKSNTGVESIGILSPYNMELNFEIESEAKQTYSYAFKGDTAISQIEMNVLLKEYLTHHPNYRFHVKYFEQNYFIENGN